MNAARAAGALEPRAAGAKKHCTLGLDLGTSSAKAVVTDIGGKVLAQASAGYAVTSAVSGYAESDPEAKTNVAAFREGLQKLGWTEGHKIWIDTRCSTAFPIAVSPR